MTLASNISSDHRQVHHCNVFCPFDEVVQFDHMKLNDPSSIRNHLIQEGNKICALEKLLKHYTKEKDLQQAWKGMYGPLNFCAGMTGTAAVGSFMPIPFLIFYFLTGSPLNVQGLIICSGLIVSGATCTGIVVGRYKYCQHQMEHYQGHITAIQEYQKQVSEQTHVSLILKTTIEGIQAKLNEQGEDVQGQGSQKITPQYHVVIDDAVSTHTALECIAAECKMLVNQFQQATDEILIMKNNKQDAKLGKGVHYAYLQDNIIVILGCNAQSSRETTYAELLAKYQIAKNQGVGLNNDAPSMQHVVSFRKYDKMILKSH